MGRKKGDPERDASIARIQAALNNQDFRTRLYELVQATVARGGSHPFQDKHDGIWDEQRGYVIQFGLYYHIRDLCDQYGLWWQKDQRYIAQLANEILYRQRMPDAIDLARPALPPREHWKWFRMARTGLGRPSPAEIAIVPPISPQGHRRHSFSEGVTEQDIAEHFAQTDAKTVQRAIRACWAYLNFGAVHIGDLADQLGIEGDWWVIFLQLSMDLDEARVRRRKKDK